MSSTDVILIKYPLREHYNKKRKKDTYHGQTKQNSIKKEKRTNEHPFYPSFSPLFFFFHCPVVNPRSNFWRVIVMHIHFKRLFWRIPTSPPPPRTALYPRCSKCLSHVDLQFSPKVFTMLTRKNARNSWMTVEIHFCFLPFTIFRMQSESNEGGGKKQQTQATLHQWGKFKCWLCHMWQTEHSRSSLRPPPPSPTDYYNDIFAHWLRLIDKYNSAGVAPSPQNSETVGESLNRWFRYSYSGIRITNELIITQKQW